MGRAAVLSALTSGRASRLRLKLSGIDATEAPRAPPQVPTLLRLHPARLWLGSPHRSFTLELLLAFLYLLTFRLTGYFDRVGLLASSPAPPLRVAQTLTPLQQMPSPSSSSIPASTSPANSAAPSDGDSISFHVFYASLFSDDKIVTLTAERSPVECVLLSSKHVTS